MRYPGLNVISWFTICFHFNLYLYVEEKVLAKEAGIILSAKKKDATTHARKPTSDLEAAFDAAADYGEDPMAGIGGEDGKDQSEKGKVREGPISAKKGLIGKKSALEAAFDAAAELDAAAGREGCVSLCMTPIGQPCVVNQ
jgi:hypothetical protein